MKLNKRLEELFMVVKAARVSLLKFYYPYGYKLPAEPVVVLEGELRTPSQQDLLLANEVTKLTQEIEN